MNALFVSHYPSPRTKLASLVKGRWLDGKAQAVVLLRFNCDTSAFFIHQTFLPPRRRDCIPLHPTFPSSQPLQKDNNPFALHYHPCLLMNALPVSHSHYPSPCTTTLASLVKGEVLSPEKIRATTGGIATSLLPKPHYTSKSTISLPPLSKVRCCRPKEFGRLPEGLLFYRTLSVSQTPPLTIPQ